MGTPNDIYHQTRSSLMDIVSANVADNTLESVMNASGLTQETIDANHMIELIKGPIYREFQTIVPKEGLKRQLTKILGELQKVEGRSSSIQSSTTRSSTTQSSSTQSSATQSSVAQSSTTQGVARQGSAKQGVARQGSAKQGVARQGSAKQGTSQQVTSQSQRALASTPNGSTALNGSRAPQASKASKKSLPIRTRIPGLTKINPNAIGVPRAYFRDPRDDGFNTQMPLYGTDPHVVLDNGTRAVVRYWVSEVALLDAEEIKKAGFRRYSFMVEEESHPNPTIVKLLQMLREEEEAEKEALMLERLALEAKAAAERDIANAADVASVEPQEVIQVKSKDIEKLVEHYAELEEVRFIATLSRDGAVLNTKGRGLEIELVKKSVLASLERLSLPHFKEQYPERAEVFSRCKSILIQHQSGLLYLLDYVDTIVLIYGTNDLNIGLMYSYASRVGVVEEGSEVSGDLAKEITDEDFKELA